MSIYLQNEVAYSNHDRQLTINREYGNTPNGNQIDGRWVLRVNGVFIDVDRHRHDLMERHSLRIASDY